MIAEANGKAQAGVRDEHRTIVREAAEQERGSGNLSAILGQVDGLEERRREEREREYAALVGRLAAGEDAHPEDVADILADVRRSTKELREDVQRAARHRDSIALLRRRDEIAAEGRAAARAFTEAKARLKAETKRLEAELARARSRRQMSIQANQRMVDAEYALYLDYLTNDERRELDCLQARATARPEDMVGGGSPEAKHAYATLRARLYRLDPPPPLEDFARNTAPPEPEPEEQVLVDGDAIDNEES